MTKFLFHEGVLNEWNATTLALAYAEEMQKNANLHVVAGNPESKFKAMSDGYKNFLKSFGLFFPEKFADIASGLGNEMKLIGNQFGKGASIALS
ncbi:hypothetical protein AVEN_19483-1 [Araneus ventricosus]|uniref:Uncharacterized protein n=1 Tax=Araneus ventricosus TaxID=182803 RepID=A0A4Y2WLL3_ARAVE|nr:hypothetical protein AVEN_6604-1 [Araneus ventricosus]GBO38002.1 hypothetical protein AVEN_19483-1 [Araneus ventricosus]